MSETLNSDPSDTDETIEDDGEADRQPIDLTEDAEEPEDPHLTAEPPSAVDLGVAVAGLPLQRARLVRFATWIARCRQELQSLEQGRSAYLESEGVLALTQARIQELFEADTSRLLGMIRGGAAAITKKDARSFEREQLEQKLAGDRHAAEVSRAALDHAEAEIDALRGKIGILERRHAGFVRDAMIEHADGLAAVYLRQAEATRAALLPLMGLGTIARDRNGYRGQFAGDEVRVELPTFGLPALSDGVTRGMARIRPAGYARPPAIVVTAMQTKAAAEPWHELMRAWTADPRAEPPSSITSPAGMNP